MKNQVIQLYHYHTWANDRLIARLNELPDDVYSQQIKSVFSSIQEVIIHTYQVDGMWLSVMSGHSFSETMKVINKLKENSNGQDLKGMRNLYKKLSVQYETFLADHKDLDTPMTIKHPKFGTLEISVSQQLRHVVNHGTYHRGNIAAMIRQHGYAGVSTDYIFFLYEQA